MCTCDAGFRGNDCSQDCGCNEHCLCATGADSGSLTCLNHTTGNHCESCLPGYYGNAVNGGVCHSCFDACNNQTAECSAQLNVSTNATHSLYTVRCTNCGGDWTGRLCDECPPGFIESAAGCFRLTTPIALSPSSDASTSVSGSSGGRGNALNGGASVVTLNDTSTVLGLAQAQDVSVPMTLQASNQYTLGIAMVSINTTSEFQGRDLMVVIFSPLSTINSTFVDVTAAEPAGNSTRRQVTAQLHRWPEHGLIQVIIGCADVDFVRDTVFVQFQSFGTNVDASYAVVWGPQRNVMCSTCYSGCLPANSSCDSSSCPTPCVGGYYQSTARPNRCQPCVCSAVSSDETSSNDPSHSPCVTTLDSIPEEYQGTLFAGSSARIVQKNVRYTNLGVRILFEVGVGAATATATLDPGSSLTDERLVGLNPTAQLATSGLMTSFSRAILTVDPKSWNDEPPRFYIHVCADTDTEFLV